MTLRPGHVERLDEGKPGHIRHVESVAVTDDILTDAGERSRGMELAALDRQIIREFQSVSADYIRGIDRAIAAGEDYLQRLRAARAMAVTTRLDSGFISAALPLGGGA